MWGPGRGMSMGTILFVRAVGTVRFAGMAIYGFSVDRRLSSQGTSAEAKVLLVSTGGRGDRVEVEFTALDGRVVRTRCRCQADEMVVGDTVWIRYDPHAPDKDVEQAGTRPAQAMAIAASAGAAVLLVAAGYAAWRLRRDRHGLLPR